MKVVILVKFSCLSQLWISFFKKKTKISSRILGFLIKKRQVILLNEIVQSKPVLSWLGKSSLDPGYMFKPQRTFQMRGIKLKEHTYKKVSLMEKVAETVNIWNSSYFVFAPHKETSGSGVCFFLLPEFRKVPYEIGWCWLHGQRVVNHNMDEFTLILGQIMAFLSLVSYLTSCQMYYMLWPTSS